MANLKYLITVDSETGEVTKLQLMGEGGELKDVDLSELTCDGGTAGGGTTINVNIFAGDQRADVKLVKPPPKVFIRHIPHP
jgi:hypothetical protein